MKKTLLKINLSLLLLCSSVAAYSQISLNTFPDDKIMVVAHRADWREAPENSIMAIKKAIEKGVNMVEIDLALTKDGVLILMHDKTIDRTTTGKGSPSDYTLEEIKKLYLRDGLGVPTQMKVPTLAEVLDVTNGKIFINLDKAFDYFDLVYPILKERKMFDQILFKGTATYDEFNKKYGKIKDEIHYMPIVRLNSGEGWIKVNEYLKNYKVYGFELTLGKDEKNLIDFKEIRKKHVKVWVNSLWPELSAGHNDDKVLENPDMYQWYPDHQVNIIQTDRPKELIEFLKKKNLYSFSR
ncbi:glycerophosphodiester phosphodiesterase [Chryseobacterium lactis]|uniref:Glycerophosphodiester phosphodiesterase n=1 Tax=Chryseobacterium lactis TaxID=1241981 RepID=A0A3G6RLE2_CHRLC|nr:glycerophosphodiester phosphodiesterase family protein [Chryseobacterium lactis]AZA83644.1 glycerophosphodiester phosphodiesterase [Chryseobacterium lactis]AZB04029.1 glycerophosphodiester phosphodiesterase [Chryseobacterium lactis]PNW13062.1 glycerophosphodiester phosphodiesterase [Chryseobacterium lactis]